MTQGRVRYVLHDARCNVHASGVRLDDETAIRRDRPYDANNADVVLAHVNRLVEHVCELCMPTVLIRGHILFQRLVHDIKTIERFDEHLLARDCWVPVLKWSTRLRHIDPVDDRCRLEVHVNTKAHHNAVHVVGVCVPLTQYAGDFERAVGVVDHDVVGPFDAYRMLNAGRNGFCEHGHEGVDEVQGVTGSEPGGPHE